MLLRHLHRRTALTTHALVFAPDVWASFSSSAAAADAQQLKQPSFLFASLHLVSIVGKQNANLVEFNYW